MRGDRALVQVEHARDLDVAQATIESERDDLLPPWRKRRNQRAHLLKRFLLRQSIFRQGSLIGQFDPALFPTAEWRECNRMALAVLEIGGASLMFMKPRSLEGAFGGVVNAGAVDSFTPGSVVHFPAGRFFLVCSFDGGFLAVYQPDDFDQHLPVIADEPVDPEDPAVVEARKQGLAVIFRPLSRDYWPPETAWPYGRLALGLVAYAALGAGIGMLGLFLTLGLVLFLLVGGLNMLQAYWLPASLRLIHSDHAPSRPTCGWITAPS